MRLWPRRTLILRCDRLASRIRQKYKLKVLAELGAADSKAERGEIMRREGLYSSLISAWRDQRDKGALEAMRASRPGPKADATKAELARLRAKVTDLEDKLATAEELIEAQGKHRRSCRRCAARSADPAS
ncbi:MAG: hypothetical protein R2696_16310 [Microthrixaceae bacterium]